MASVVPYLFYADPKAAIAFLQEAFGFRQIQAFDGEDGELQHAEVASGDGVVMIGHANQPVPTAGGVYVVVEDVDAHHQTAIGAGAKEVMAPHDTPFGTRMWRGKDAEGHEWSFGTYQPKA